MTVIDHLEPLDRALVAKGFPAMSPWWRSTVERFYRSGRRQLVARVGRRGGKSSTLCRLAVLEALYGEHSIPPGDVGVIAFVSTRREEAGERLRTIRAILDALGVPYSERDQTIELRSKPIAFRVFVASIAGVVGFTAIMVIADETARWRDSEVGSNPADEVLASLRPTMATQPNAKLILSSSPLGSTDAHARAFNDGETDHQCVAHAETWTANPTITEAQTRRDEPDERIWRREYAAIPQAGKLAAFDEDAVALAFNVREEDEKHGRVMVIDPSSGRKDSFTWGIVGWSRCGSKDYLKFDHVDGLAGSFWKQWTADRVVDRLAEVADAYRIENVYADQREAFALQPLFTAKGLVYESIAWTSQSKIAAVEMLRRHFREETIELPDHPQLRRELALFEERVTPSGSLTFDGRSGHDDYVALLITAAMAVTTNRLIRGDADRHAYRTPYREQPIGFGYGRRRW